MAQEAHLSPAGYLPSAIALETSKGDLALALGLGIILIVLSLGVNAAAFILRDLTGRHS